MIYARGILCLVDSSLTLQKNCTRMGVPKPSIHFPQLLPARNIGSFDWFVISEKENRERAQRRIHLCRMLLYEIKMCQ
jgi:hypothetical protein